MVNDNNNQWLWHRRLGHANMKLTSKLVKLSLVNGLPNINFENDKICVASQFEK